MAVSKIKVTILEKDGEEYELPVEYNLDAESIRVNDSDSRCIKDYILAHTGAVGSFELTFAAGLQKSAYVTTDNYFVLTRFIFRGTGNVGTPTNIKIIGYVESSEGSYCIYDVTNSQCICEATGKTDTDPTIYDMGSLSNLPAGESIFEVQAKNSSNGKRAYIESLVMVF